MSRLEVGIERHWLDLGPSDEAVSGIVADLKVGGLEGLLLARLAINAFAVEETEVIVIGENRAERVVPHDLGRDVRVVQIEHRERKSCDIADDTATVR